MEAVLGRYRVLKHLASGGMADVLLGRTDGIEGFERHVVLKRIRTEHARDKRFISMFIDEARLAAGLHHQSIVQVFDIGEANGEYFFAMEYIHGEDLRKLLSNAAKARTYVPLQLVCAIVSAAASALHYAHERRDSKGKPLEIVHRDVSPSNILIGYDGAVKVVDFGIAKAALRRSETIAGSLKGKCSYMSPEQCKGERVDRRSDVYGLGVLLYELATTSRLFKGDNEYLVMDAIVNGKLTLPQVRRPDLPNELSSIIMRALAVDATRRYQTADDLRVEIDELAARSYGAVTTATLAGYMKKMFGVRPEPWLDPSSDLEVGSSGLSWDVASTDRSSRDSRRSFSSLPKAVAAAADNAQRVSPHETASTQKFGWEAARRMQAARGSKLPWIAGALLAIAGFGVWKLALDRHHAPQTAASPPSIATSTAASAAPAVPAASVVASPPAAEEVAAASAPSPAAAPAPASAPAPIAESASDDGWKPVTEQHAKKPERVKTGKLAVASAMPAPSRSASAMPAASRSASTTPAPATPAPPAPTPTPPAPVAAPATPVAQPTPAPATTASPAPVTPPAPPAAAIAPSPKEIEASMPMLSNATVSAIASDHSAQLSKCEGGATLKGDIAVSFQIDGTGKVVKSQLSSTIKNPKVAACVLKAVQSWNFPKPPAGAAKGVYSITYQ